MEDRVTGAERSALMVVAGVLDQDLGRHRIAATLAGAHAHGEKATSGTEASLRELIAAPTAADKLLMTWPDESIRTASEPLLLVAQRDGRCVHSVAMTRTALLVAMTPLVLVACTSSPLPGATPSSAPPAASGAMAPLANAPGATAPTATASALAASTWLMTHVCGCNRGCARVPVPESALHEGLRTTAESGPYAGRDMLVVNETDAVGKMVFALSDRDPSHACERATRDARTLVGFVCESKDNGPVPAKACAEHGPGSVR